VSPGPADASQQRAAACEASPAPEPLVVGALRVEVTRSCARRDLYDLRLGRPIDPALREALAPWGSLQGSAALWVVDAPGRYRITVAPAAGRVVILPRMEPSRAEQRAHATEFFAWLEAQVSSWTAPR
jgi:hypothetical protein